MGIRGGKSRTWPKSTLDAGLARVGRPSEKGGPSKLEINFHWTICGDVEFHECLVNRREGVVRERVAEKDVVTVREEISMPSSSSASEGGSSNNWEESEEEQDGGRAAETVDSEGRDEEEEESAGQEKEVGLKSSKRSGAGGVGGEEKSGCQEEEEGSKGRRKIGVRGGPVEGEREEGGKTTFALHELIMQRLIARN